jgi:hypothetical protein
MKKCLKLKLVVGLYITGWERTSPEAQSPVGRNSSPVATRTKQQFGFLKKKNVINLFSILIDYFVVF